jgi:hypothetical protein
LGSLLFNEFELCYVLDEIVIVENAVLYVKYRVSQRLQRIEWGWRFNLLRTLYLHRELVFGIKHLINIQ